MSGPPPSQPCGTPAAARRHYRAEGPGWRCEACRAAERIGRKDPDRSLSEDTRVVRNGLPFIPYVWRGVRSAVD